jgi:hypothetical protein
MAAKVGVAAIPSHAVIRRVDDLRRIDPSIGSSA